VKTLHEDAAEVSRVRIKLLFFYWLDKEGKIKEIKILKIVPSPSNILVEKRKN
jgi:hypothetical protein